MEYLETGVRYLACYPETRVPKWIMFGTVAITCTRSPTLSNGWGAVGHFVLRNHARMVLHHAIPNTNCSCAMSTRPCLGFLKSRVRVGSSVSIAYVGS